MQVPADVRWLGGAKGRARFQREGCDSSSAVAAVLGEAVFGRLCKSGVQLPGGRYEADAFEEERPDALCLRCGEWSHATPHCDEARRPKCHLHKGTRYEGPPVLGRGLLGGKGPHVPTRDSKVCELRRPP